MGTHRSTTHAQPRFRPGVIRQAQRPDRAKLELTALEDRLALSGTPTVINFDDLANGTVVTAQYQSEGVIFSSGGGAGNVVSAFAEYGGSSPNTLGTFYDAGGSYNDNTYLDFTSPVSGLSFLALADNQTGTMGVVNVIQKDGTHTTVPMIGDNDPYTPSPVDLSSFRNVIRIEIINVVDPAGLIYDNFTFTPSGSGYEATDLSWSSSGNLTFSYTVTGSDIPKGAKASIYWADGPTEGDAIGKPITTVPLNNGAGDYGPIEVSGGLYQKPPKGATHVVIVLDSTDLVDEANENDNVADVRYGPDLNVTSFEVDTTHSSPSTRSISGTTVVRNDGSVKSGPFQLIFYASSTDTAYSDAADVSLGSTLVPSLKPGESVTITKSFFDPIYHPGVNFSSGYFLGAQTRLGGTTEDANATNDFRTKDGSGGDGHIAGDLAIATGLIAAGLGGVASQHLYHYVNGDGSAMDWGAGSLASVEVANTGAFAKAQKAAVEYVSKLIRTQAKSATGSFDYDTTIPQSVIGLPVFQPLDSPDLYAGVHGTQGSSGVADLHASVSTIFGKKVVVVTGIMVITLTDRYSFEYDDALKGGPNDDMRHLALAGYAKPFDVSIEVPVPVFTTLLI